MLLDFIKKHPFEPLRVSLIVGIWIVIDFVLYGISIPELFESQPYDKGTLSPKLFTALFFFITGVAISTFYIWTNRHSRKHIETVLGLILIYVQFFIIVEATSNILGYFIGFHPDLFLNDNFTGAIEAVGFLFICVQYFIRHPKSLWQFLNWFVDLLYYNLPGMGKKGTQRTETERESHTLVGTISKLIFVMVAAYAFKMFTA